MKKIKSSTFFLLFFSFFISSSQIDIFNPALKKEVEVVCKKRDKNFHKAHEYFFNQEIDSSFFYCSQFKEYNSMSASAKDFLNYMYGFTAFDKQFYSLAQEKLTRVSQDFNGKYLVDYCLGSIAIENRAYKDAVAYFELVNQSNKIKDYDKLKKLYHNLGVSYLHLKNYKASEKSLLKGLEISIAQKDTLNIIYSKMDLGNLFYDQYKDKKAIVYFKEAYELAKLLPDYEVKQSTTENLAVVEKQRNNFKESVRYYEEYIKWKDSLWNRDKVYQLLEKDKAISIAIKDKEIFIQKETAEKQKDRIRIFTIAIILSAIFLAVLFYLYRVKTKQNILITTQKKQLEDLNATKNHLLSVISHDLRTPVNLLKQNHKKLAELLKNDSIYDAKVLNNKSTNIAESTTKLLDNILNWALQQNNQLLFMPESHPIEILLDSLMYDLRPLAATKEIETTVTYMKDHIEVFLDKELFKIVLRNLIDNAIKYTPEHGKIAIEVASINNDCIIKIKDTGIGIPDPVLEVINTYEILTVEKIDRSKGLGLGLVLAKTIIARNKGTFKIVNNTDSGITITITVPTKDT